MDALKLGESTWLEHINCMRALEQVVDRSCTRGESGVLLFLFHAGRPAYPGELTEKLGLTTGRIANILKVLEQTGMIMRTTDARDRRRVQVELTQEGESAARARHEDAMRCHAALMDQLDAEQARRLAEALRALSDAACMT